MKYLSSAVNFTIRNWMLILPVFVLLAIVNIIGGFGSALNLGAITSLASADSLADPSVILKTVFGILAAAAIAAIVGFIARLIYEPATYGLVNKSLESGSASLNDLGAAIGGNFVKYVIYFVGMLVVVIVTVIAATLVILLLGLIFSLLKGFGMFLMFIVLLALAVFFIVLFVMLSMWFAAMVVDGLDVVAAAKKSIEVVKGSFWTVLGVTILVGIICGIAGWILHFITVIPVIGAIIYSVVPTVQYFVMAVFYLMLYREKTGRTNVA